MIISHRNLYSGKERSCEGESTLKQLPTLGLSNQYDDHVMGDEEASTLSITRKATVCRMLGTQLTGRGVVSTFLSNPYDIHDILPQPFSIDPP